MDVAYSMGEVIVEGKGAVWGEFEASLVTNGDGDALFPNYFQEGLIHYLKTRFNDFIARIIASTSLDVGCCYRSRI